MQGIDPKWYARMMWYQKKHNVILASATTILAITSILQIIKLYGGDIPTIFLIIFIGIIEIAFTVMIFESFKNPKF